MGGVEENERGIGREVPNVEHDLRRCILKVDAKFSRTKAELVC